MRHLTLPRTVVGFLGFQHDRRLALQALAVSAARKDVHGVFAGYSIDFSTLCFSHWHPFSLSLMTYYGVVLLMSGYQANEQHIVKQYRAIVDR